METRKTRTKRVEYDVDFQADSDDEDSAFVDPDDIRKSKIRDCNKEFAKRMTILQTWAKHWSDYTTREGDAYPLHEAKSIIKTKKKIACPIQACRKVFTTMGGLRYHYARCNIERCFKCKVCDPQSEHKTRGDLLRHLVRSHYNQLPELHGEQKEIAQSYLSSNGRNEKAKPRKSHGDPESHLNCRMLVKSYFDILHNSISNECAHQKPFRDWQTSIQRDWDLLFYEIDKRQYYPPERESANFRYSSSLNWNKIQAGDSTILKNEAKINSESVVFYTGGITTASAWLPKPPNNSLVKWDPEIIAVSVTSCPMDRSFLYKDCKDATGCIQFWSVQTKPLQSHGLIRPRLESKASLEFMVGHNYGVIFEMSWCPLGSSWQPNPDAKSSSVIGGDSATPSTVQPRMGLLALACGDGQVRIISVPHLDCLKKNRHEQTTGKSLIESTVMYRVNPVATLMAPGVGPSTDYQIPACTALHWGIHDNQRILVVGYSNGNVALFDLANYSPILYSKSAERHVYQPLKSWLAHGLPVTGVGISSGDLKRMVVVTGSRDKQIKMWNLMDLNSFLVTEKAPVTKVAWDFRLKGAVVATESAFTSFNNRVGYRFPALDGFNMVTISCHRATVWGLDNSLITSALVTSDEAGEVFVCPLGRPPQKRDKSHLNTHSYFTLLPHRLDQKDSFCQAVSDQNHSTTLNENHLLTNHQLGVVVTGSEQHMQLDNSATTTAAASGSSAACPNVRITSIDEENQITVEQCIDLEHEMNDENHDMISDYTFVERQVANKPANFLLPIEHRAIETYNDFRTHFGLEFHNYDTSTPTAKDQKLPKSCLRASDQSQIYCDRVCDYPFCSIKQVEWSPNVDTFQCLLSTTHIGLCRLDVVEIVEQVYGNYVESFRATATTATTSTSSSATTTSS